MAVVKFVFALAMSATSVGPGNPATSNASLETAVKSFNALPTTVRRVKIESADVRDSDTPAVTARLPRWFESLALTNEEAKAAVAAYAAYSPSTETVKEPAASWDALDFALGAVVAQAASNAERRRDHYPPNNLTTVETATKPAKFRFGATPDKRPAKTQLTDGFAGLGTCLGAFVSLADKASASHQDSSFDLIKRSVMNDFRDYRVSPDPTCSL